MRNKRRSVGSQSVPKATSSPGSRNRGRDGHDDGRALTDGGGDALVRPERDVDVLPTSPFRNIVLKGIVYVHHA